MSESNPMRPAYNMKKYRRAIRLAWKTMQHQYADGMPRPEILPLTQWVDKGLETRWPSVEDFEIRATKRKQEDRL